MRPAEADERHPATGGPVLAIHAGAGSFDPELHAAQDRCRGVLDDALRRAGALLQSGGHAVDVVREAVVILESFGLFNAGYGSALCSDGSVQMSAALMRGSDRAAGAVAGVRRTRHPILAADAVLASEHVLMVGDEADALAAYTGAEQWPNRSFVTEYQLGLLHDRPAGRGHGTVGAVCLDAHGVLAAATSTGGIRGQPPGRIGDSPVIGAGTWADRHAAVSCTGDGEAFIRAGVAHRIAMLTGTGTPLPHACDAALAEVSGMGGSGGLIAVDAAGNVAAPRLTEIMPRGISRPGQEPCVWIDR